MDRDRLLGFMFGTVQGLDSQVRDSGHQVYVILLFSCHACSHDAIFSIRPLVSEVSKAAGMWQSSPGMDHKSAVHILHDSTIILPVTDHVHYFLLFSSLH